MITNNGKIHIKRYLAGYEPAIGRSIAFGIGTVSESATNFKLQFETGRADVTLVAYDFANDRVVFKAPLPDDFGGEIHEVALYSNNSDTIAGDGASRVITTFDSATETWVDPSSGTQSTFGTTGVRIGDDALKQTPAAGSTRTDSLADLLLDLSAYSGSDKFVFAFNCANANADAITFQFMNDSSNYFTITLPAQSTGYKVTEVAKASAVATGNPDWNMITELRVSTKAKAGGAANVQFDGIRIDDADTVNPEYTMVAREVLDTPYIKQEGKVQEVEIYLDVTV